MGSGTGTSTNGASSQGSTADRVQNDNVVSQHQARLQAAASAASLYEKSFVYPSPNALTCGLPQQYANTSFAWSAQCTSVPPQFPCMHGELESGSNAQLALHNKLIQHQIEFMQNQLQLLQKSKREKTVDQVSSDIKGKSVPSSSSSVIDS